MARCARSATIGVSLAALALVRFATLAPGPATARPIAAERVIDLAEEPADVTVVGSPSKDQLGNDIHLGDLNADGIADLAMGAHWSSASGRNIVGRAYVLFGRTAWPEQIDAGNSGMVDWSFFGAGREARMGSAVTIADLGGDATADLALGSLMADPFDQHNGGSVYVMLGGRGARGAIDFREVAPDVLLAGDSRTQDSDQLGTDIATGDFNGDRRTDIAVAAALRAGGTGGVFVWYGPFARGTVRNLHDRPADWAIIGPASSAWLGAAIAAGDVDGDGIDDLAVSAINSGRGDGPADGGVVHIFRGGSGARGTVHPVSTPADTTIIGRPGAFVGVAMSLGTCSCRGRPILLGDVTGDGLTDVVVGAPLDEARRGSVSIVAGPIGRGVIDLASAGTARAVGIAADGRFGWWLTRGRLDSDAAPDLVVAAPWAEGLGRAKTGAVYGLRGPLPATGLAATMTDAPFALFGPRMSSGNAGISLAVADSDADGTDDLHLGFPDDAPLGRNSAGAVYIVRGPLLDAPPTASATVVPTVDATASPFASATSTFTPTVPPPSPTATDHDRTPTAPAPTPPPPGRRVFLPVGMRGT